MRDRAGHCTRLPGRGNVIFTRFYVTRAISPEQSGKALMRCSSPMDAFLAWGWVRKSPATRAVTVTALGWDGLKEHFDIAREACEPA